MTNILYQSSMRIAVCMLITWCFSSIPVLANNAAVFAKHPSYGMARLSPDGKHLALYVDADSAPSIAVLEVDTKKPI